MAESQWSKFINFTVKCCKLQAGPVAVARDCHKRLSPSRLDVQTVLTDPVGADSPLFWSTVQCVPNESKLVISTRRKWGSAKISRRYMFDGGQIRKELWELICISSNYCARSIYTTVQTKGKKIYWTGLFVKICFDIWFIVVQFWEITGVNRLVERSKRIHQKAVGTSNSEMEFRKSACAPFAMPEMPLELWFSTTSLYFSDFWENMGNQIGSSVLR